MINKLDKWLDDLVKSVRNKILNYPVIVGMTFICGGLVFAPFFWFLFWLFLQLLPGIMDRFDLLIIQYPSGLLNSMLLIMPTIITLGSFIFYIWGCLSSLRLVQVGITKLIKLRSASLGR